MPLFTTRTGPRRPPLLSGRGGRRGRVAAVWRRLRPAAVPACLLFLFLLVSALPLRQDCNPYEGVGRPAAAGAQRRRGAPAPAESDTRETATAETAAWSAALTLCAAAEPDGEGGWTLTLEAWQNGAGAGPDASAVLCYTLSTALQADPAAAPHAYLLEKTRTGWGSVKQPLPADAVQFDPDAGTLRVTGFAYAAHPVTDKPALDETGHTTYGRKLVVRLDGIRPAYARTYGGQGMPVGGGGLFTAAGVQGAAFAPTAVDLPLRCAFAPADQTLAPGAAVNFGYMLRPPGAAGLPDGVNNALCDLCYTISDETGPVAVYEVPAGEPMGAGCWTTPPPDHRPAAGTTRRYTVTVALRAVRTASGTENPAAARLRIQSTALVRTETD